MTSDQLSQRLKEVVGETLPAPATGNSASRHLRLLEIAREDVTLAKLAEAHWDALAILAEAGRTTVSGALYAVWASELPGHELALISTDTGYLLSGRKLFCSGIGLVDRALITTGGAHPQLVDLDLRLNQAHTSADLSSWKVAAFAATHTGSITFAGATLGPNDLVGDPGWYVARPGFWHGACGPAACWAGAVAGLLDYARSSHRADPHTLAHLGAMQANVWAMAALLTQAGQQMDANPNDRRAAQVRALQLRHVVEQLATDVLRRFARAYGPQPLCMNEAVSRRYAEADLYLRQSHAERDLQALADLVRS